MTRNRTVDSNSDRAYRPVLDRPRLSVGRRLGVPMLWDPDPPQGEGGGEPTPDDGPTPDDKPRMFTEDEVKAKLRGQGKQLKEYRDKAARLDELERERAEAEEADAKKRGEFERLHTEAKTALEEAASERDSLKERIGAYEKIFERDVKEQVEAIEDEGFRGEVKDRLKGRSIMDQRDILSLISKARSTSHPPDSETQPRPPRRQGGPPGRNGSKIPSGKELAKNPALKHEAAMAALEDFRRQQAAKG